METEGAGKLKFSGLRPVGPYRRRYILIVSGVFCPSILGLSGIICFSSARYTISLELVVDVPPPFRKVIDDASSFWRCWVHLASMKPRKNRKSNVGGRWRYLFDPPKKRFAWVLGPCKLQKLRPGRVLLSILDATFFQQHMLSMFFERCEQTNRTAGGGEGNHCSTAAMI